MPSASAMASAAHPAWRGQLARCVAASRRYGTRPSTSKLAREESLSQAHKKAHASIFKDGNGPLLPCTFVPLPLSQCPRTPSDFVQYQWNRAKLWLVAAASVLNVRLRSMPDWRTRPQWKARRSAIAPTAKAMYREVLEAFAAGDRDALRRLCVPDFAKKLIAAVDRREPRQSVRFQLVKYNKPLFYPRLCSRQIQPVNPFDRDMLMEQAVVAVCSTQQASRHDAATGDMVPGSLKLQDKIEYVILSRQINGKTFETDRWRVWGTTSATTLQECLDEQAAITKEQIRRAGWDEPKVR